MMDQGPKTFSVRSILEPNNEPPFHKLKNNVDARPGTEVNTQQLLTAQQNQEYSLPLHPKKEREGRKVSTIFNETQPEPPPATHLATFDCQPTQTVQHRSMQRFPFEGLALPHWHQV